jgi:hypothetical protein
MRLISFKQTTLFKRGIWLSAVALIAFVIIPSLSEGSLWGTPVPTVIALCVLIAFFGYFLWKLPIHRLADSVIDCGDHLVVRKRWTQEITSLSNVAGAEVSSSLGVHRIRIRLRKSSSLGQQIEFLPQASLWSSISGVQQVARDLTDRADRANGVIN